MSGRNGLAWPNRSEEHTSELQSHRYIHSFPTRRSSDLLLDLGNDLRLSIPLVNLKVLAQQLNEWQKRTGLAKQIGRAHVRTPVTPIYTLFPDTTLFRSPARPWQ